jgi:hypothetical protein
VSFSLTQTVLLSPWFKTARNDGRESYPTDNIGRSINDLTELLNRGPHH